MHILKGNFLCSAKQLKTFSNSRKTSPSRTPKKQTKMHSLLDPSRLRPPPLTGATNAGADIPPSSELTAGQNSKVNLTLGLQRDIDSIVTPNPLHLQPAADRDIIIRNRIKTPTLHDDAEIDNDADEDDNEIMSISSVQFPGNTSVV